ncbi:TPA: Arc family DNA-binding protein [Stenotrophomonas maltophilia]|uniref:Arc family DNA-binding protein n=1 Tax=Stenotrophomonas maltophilia TaxID=40324 RepID=UPI002A9C443D|nr:Arc family DNA-binding protein [Stenotrophomonas maltophilia]HEL3760451.1 Arc family DNA-binding protein [Stenotrophomonas maltophilia]
MSLRIGYVYCLKSKTSGNVKIGWAVDVAARRAALATGSEAELDVAAFFSGTMGAEAWVKGLLADRRLRGEWFRDDDGLVSQWFALTEALRSEGVEDLPEVYPETLSAEHAQFKLRLPKAILERVAALANENFRSTGAEIAWRLQKSFGQF